MRPGDVVEFRGPVRLVALRPDGMAEIEIRPWGMPGQPTIYAEVVASTLMSYGPACSRCGGKMREFDFGNKRLCANRDAHPELHQGQDPQEGIERPSSVDR